MDFPELALQTFLGRRDKFHRPWRKLNADHADLRAKLLRTRTGRAESRLRSSSWRSEQLTEQDPSCCIQQLQVPFRVASWVEH
jgi:hypothetical protein